MYLSCPTLNVNFELYYNSIVIPVTKRVNDIDEIKSIVDRFINEKLTFALSMYRKRYEVWRSPINNEIFTMDKSYTKDLNNRNFIRIWDKGELVFPKMTIVV